MDRTVDRVGNGYRLCALGDLNGWIRDKVGASATGAFGVPGENDSERRVVEFCTERRLCVGNTYFKHKSWLKYTRVARGQDGVEVMSIIDPVLVKKDMLRFLHITIDRETLTLRQARLLTHLLLILFNSLPPKSYILSTCPSVSLLTLSYAFSRSINPHILSRKLSHLSA